MWCGSSNTGRCACDSKLKVEDEGDGKIAAEIVHW